MARRVVITSVGVVSPLGNSLDAIVKKIQRGNGCFEKSKLVPNLPVCPVRKFDLASFIGRFKNKRYLNRGAMFAVAAAKETIRKASLEQKALLEAGLFVGAGPCLDLNAFPDIQDNIENWSTVPALWMLKFLPNTAASVIAQLFDIHGENITTGTACAASLTAIGEAFRKVRDGYMELALAGGGDSRLSHGALMAYKKANALVKNGVKNGDAPETTMRPFDEARSGFVPGEGGSFVMLESLEHAKQRKATILAEICGYASTMDGHGMTAPAPDGKWAKSAVRMALKDANIHPEHIDVVSAHGTGTPLNDAVEADVIHRIFAPYRPWVIAVKSWIGHLASACGSVELAACLGFMKHNLLPEIRNLRNPCHREIRFVKRSQQLDIKTILIENFGFGGQNCALVIRKWNR